MTKFVSRNKLSKKARKQLDAQQRTTWDFSPSTRKIESKKLYNRKKKSHARYDDGMGFFYPFHASPSTLQISPSGMTVPSRMINIPWAGSTRFTRPNRLTYAPPAFFLSATK